VKVARLAPLHRDGEVVTDAPLAPVLRKIMRTVPFDISNYLPRLDRSASADLHLKQKPGDIQGIHRPQSQSENLLAIDRIAASHRVIIIEGISGSGKDTLQKYLKIQLAGKDIHDYSEGELLLSWNQLQIKGIFNLQVKFMKLFVNYMKDVIAGNDNVVFLLNRFHLSTYALNIIKQPKLEKEYQEAIKLLHSLPSHVFILQLDEKDIGKRSLHPERSGAWQKFQQEIVKKEGFRDRVARYVWQQRLMLEAAEKQQIPYSVVRLAPLSEPGVSQDAGALFSSPRPMDPAAAKTTSKKRRLPQSVQETH